MADSMINAHKGCHIGPEIPNEQFIADHIFMCLVKGQIQVYDQNRKVSAKSGDCVFGRKNQLVRFSREMPKGEYEKIVVVFDEAFLKNMRDKYASEWTDLFHKKPIETGAIIDLDKTVILQNYLSSLQPYYEEGAFISKGVQDLKREELVFILIRQQPELFAILFQFPTPEKIDLEAYMNQNYKFNVPIERFAYLTGRSLSSFKREFKKIFNDTPGRWIMKKRLEEAFFLIHKMQKKASEVYLEVGFEDLSHFSFAFKKQFGAAPTLIKQP